MSTPDHLFKILVVGNTSVGKSSCIKRVVEGLYTADYKVTVGVDFLIKQNIRVREDGADKLVYLQIWDIGGSDRDPNVMFPSFVRDAVGAFIVCSMNDERSIDNIIGWKQRILDNIKDDSIKSNFVFILLVNKMDLYTPTSYPRNFDNVARDGRFNIHFLVSAKEGTNLEEAHQTMAQRCVDVKAQSKFPSRSPIVISDPPKESSCCF